MAEVYHKRRKMHVEFNSYRMISHSLSESRVMHIKR